MGDAEFGLEEYTMFEMALVKQGLCYFKKYIQAYEIHIEAVADFSEASWCVVERRRVPKSHWVWHIVAHHWYGRGHYTTQSYTYNISRGECLIMGYFHQPHIILNFLDSSVSNSNNIFEL